jgi:hypothetical protein
VDRCRFPLTGSNYFSDYLSSRIIIAGKTVPYVASGMMLITRRRDDVDSYTKSWGDTDDR